MDSNQSGKTTTTAKGSRWKKTVIVLLSVLTALLVLGWGASVLLEKKIKQEIVTQINEQVTVPIKIQGEIGLSLFRHFPQASLTFEKVSIDDKLQKKNRPLLRVEEVSFLCNIFSLFSDKIEFSQILVRDGELHLLRNEKGKANFDIFKPSNDSTGSSLRVQLTKAVVRNVQFTYSDKAIGTSADALLKDVSLKGDFEEKYFTLETNGQLYVNTIQSGNEVFLSSRNLTVEMVLDVDNVAYKYHFKKGRLALDETAFSVNGFFAEMKEGLQLDFKLSNAGDDIRHLFALFPVRYKEALSNAEGAGAYAIEADVKGTLSKTQLPRINVSADLKDSEIKLGKYNKLLKNVNASASYHVDERGKDRIVISNFNCTLNNQPFNFKLTLTDLANPAFDFYSNGVLHLSELAPFIPDSVISNIEGTIHFHNFRLKGKKSDFTDVVNSTLTGSGEFQIHEAEFIQNEVAYGNINGLLKYEDRVVDAQQLTLNFLSTDFNFSGRIENLLPFVYNLSANRKANEVVLGLNGKVSSKVFNLTAILETYDNKNKPQHTRKGKIDIRDVFSMKGNMEVELGKFLFRKMQFNNLNTVLQLSPGMIYVNRLTTQTMGGELRASGLVNFTTNNSLNLKLDIAAIELDVASIFRDCENFGQTTMTEKNLKGQMSTTVNLNATWADYKVLDENTLSAVVDFNIKNGELIRFEPLRAASKFIRIEELEHIRFSDISNTIRISDKRIDIPDFEIKSSALNLMFFGRHYFDNNIDYHFKINLHKLLANKFKRFKKDEQYIEDDPYEGVNIFLSMTGNLSSPVIKLDKSSAKNKMLSDFKNEKENFKKMLTGTANPKVEDVREKKYFEVEEQPQFLDFDTGE